jgi:hypothetical protein
MDMGPYLQNAMVPQPGERSIIYWDVVSCVHAPSRSYCGTGFLVLTNQRCVFIRKDKGMLIQNGSFDLDQIFDLRPTSGLLEDTLNIHSSSGLFDSRINISGYEFTVANPRQVREAILHQQYLRRQEKQAGQGQEPSQQQVIREREITREIVKIRCQYCGNLYDQGLDKCPHCGGH